MEKYSLSDIAAVIGNNGYPAMPVFMGGGFGGYGSGLGGDWLGLILLALIFGNGWGGGFGGFGGGNGAFGTAALAQGFADNRVLAKLDGITQGLCDGFYAQNTNMLTGFSSIGSQIAENRFAAQQCCCETNRNIDAVRFDNQKCCCEITNAIHREGEETRALINANTMQNLRDKLADKDRDLQTANFQLSQQAQNATLINTLRPFPTPSYITCSPYESARGNHGAYGCGGCGFGY
ncbi:MAG: hypothetical protein ACLRFN_01535 [Alphaproteobacteria bacterium]